MAMAGLISKMIWVWPKWDESNHNGMFRRVHFTMGWTSKDKLVQHKIAQTEDKVFCFCTVEDDTQECTSLFDAYVGNDTVDTTRTFADVSPNDCVVVKTMDVVDVSENFASKYFSMMNIGEKPVLLDIDEDFYGCTYAITPLLEANISTNKIEVLHALLADYLCPTDSRQEKESNLFLQNVISDLKKSYSCENTNDDSNQNNLTMECDKIKYSQTLHKRYTAILESLLSGGLTTRCKIDRTYNDRPMDASDFVQYFLNNIYDLNEEQLSVLQKVGFCSTTSPKTFVDDYRAFRLCSGANTPNRTAVLAHTPTEKETAQRTVKLTEILESFKTANIQLVTLARSMRDGYTPRNQFQRIEQDIIRAVRQGSAKQLRLYYDEDLLGGKVGWV